MDNDERDRRDWPEAEGVEEPSQPEVEEPSQPDVEEPSQPEVEEPSQPEVDQRAAESVSASEIESWPSQDAAPPPRDAEETRPWPTEPPSPDTSRVDAWPTTPPEREPDAVAPPEDTPTGPPPSEVEAYPAADASAAAAAAASRSAEPAPAPEAPATAAHSVPPAEADVGESTQCPRCGTENRPGLAFCRNCGQRLVAAGVASTVERPGTPEGTMACPRCGTHNRAGVAFCQNCGANLRGTAPGYVPPAVAGSEAARQTTVERRSAMLGPVVLLIGLIGLITGYLLPFAYGSGSLFDRAGGSDGWGIAFWNGFADVSGGIADQLYFALAAAVPLLALLVLALAIAGFMRAAPGIIQAVGLVIALLWSVGLIVLFVVLEVAGNFDGDVVGMLRVLTPAGIIFLLSSLIILIGALTRFARS